MKQILARLGIIFEQIEEWFIALTLGGMAIVTIINVVLRYVFNSGILWGLEVTVFLFAWLVIIGASYAMKKHLHLGIDVFINSSTPKVKKILALIAACVCVFYATSLGIGAFDYWYPFINERAFLETNDVPMPEWLQFLAPILNEGERYEKLPRFIPYFALPLGMGLLLLRSLQALWHVWRNKQDALIAAHE